MWQRKSNLQISVVIPTYNRARLLVKAIEGLTRQTVGTDLFEIVVVDDGSEDETAEICKAFCGRVRLVYERIANSGNSAAKNLGIFLSKGRFVLFFDDDDYPYPTLLAEHLQSHYRQSEEGLAVLGHTDWARWLPVTPVMHYIMNVGQVLFSYRSLRNNSLLDFTYFWAGRLSCKRSLLVKHGIFNQKFPSIYEDVELGYRLSKFGLKILYNRGAQSVMNRAITLDEFCRRSERQGRALHLLGGLHPTPVIKRFCEEQAPDPDGTGYQGRYDAFEAWRRVGPQLAPKLKCARDAEVALGSLPPHARPDSIQMELFALYRWIFSAYKLKGLAEESATRPDGLGCAIAYR